MNHRSLYAAALGLFFGAAFVFAQPGPITTANHTNLVIAAATLLTNGLPGLSGPPSTLMVATVQSNSLQGAAVSLVTGQPWVRRYNGSASNEDQATAITVDPEGNIIVAGYSYGSGSGVDFLTLKYTSAGTTLWTNRYDGPDHGADQIQALATDGAGGVYVCGTSGAGLLTIKYAADGTPVWTNAYTSTAMFMFLTGLTVDSAGNTYLASVDYDSEAYVTVKYDVNGTPAWTNFFKSSPTSQDSASDITVDSAGNFYVTGDSFDSGLGGTACLTIKCASDGSVLWSQRYSIGNDGGAGTRVLLDRDENVIVAVDFHGAAGNKYSVVKYSNAGTLMWSNVLDAVNYAGGGVPRLSVDLAGNVFLSGGTPGASTADFRTVKYSSLGVPVWTNRFVDPNSGTQEFDGAGTDNAGNFYFTIASASPGGANYNYVTLKYASNGVPAWTNRYNGPANASDLTRAMTVDKAGAVYVTGTSSSGGSGFGVLDMATVKYADNLRYAPLPSFVGQDTVTFTAFDSFGNSATGTVVINVVAGPPVTPAVVAPDDYTSVAGNGSLNTLIRSVGLSRTYQMQFTPDALGGLPVGARITELRFRAGTNTAANWPATTVTWADYEVTLAQAAKTVAAMSTGFQTNLLNPVLVKDGALSIGADRFTAGSSPNAFGALVVLDTPYVYQGGDLVMHVTHTGSDAADNIFLDAANSSVPGYGTSFRALSANSFNASVGALGASVTIVGIGFTPPVTQAITRNGNQVILNGGGGWAGAQYRILTATNVALPLAQWAPLITNQFGAGGSYSHTNAMPPNQRQQYFRVVVP